MLWIVAAGAWLMAMDQTRRYLTTRQAGRIKVAAAEAAAVEWERHWASAADDVRCALLNGGDAA